MRAQVDEHARLMAEFTASDEDKSRAAFEALMAKHRSALVVWVRGRIGRTGFEGDAEDIVQDTFLRLWSLRSTFEDYGPQALVSFLRRQAMFYLLDRYPGREGDSDEIELENIPHPERAGALEVALAHLADELFHLADAIWLGLSEENCDDWERQVLAAQLYYLDGDSWEEVRDTITPGGSGAALTREQLDAWLGHPGVIRALAYHELYFDNQRLARYLLELADRSWTDGEKFVIEWRYGRGEAAERALSRADCLVSREEFEAAVVSFRALLPFSRQMVKVLRGLDRAPGIDARHLLGQPGLWRRLAVQYLIAAELAHEDIIERTQPAAEIVGYNVTMGMLAVGLSKARGRMFAELAAAYRQRHPELDDE